MGIEFELLPDGVGFRIEQISFLVSDESGQQSVYAKAVFLGEKAMLTGGSLTEDEALVFAPFLGALGAKSVLFYDSNDGSMDRKFTEVLLIKGVNDAE